MTENRKVRDLRGIAAHFQVDEETVRQWKHQGGPFLGPPFDLQAISAWLAEREAIPPENHLNELQRILAPPAVPVRINRHWDDFERELGFTLPVHYRLFLMSYGAGTLHVGDLYSLSFFGTDGFLEQIDFPLCYLREARQRGCNSEYGVYPELGGLLPFAIGHNGELFCWVTRGDAFNWPLGVTDDVYCNLRLVFDPLPVFLAGCINGKSHLTRFSHPSGVPVHWCSEAT